MGALTKNINKCVSPFALRMGDISIAQSIWDLPPEAFLEEFVRKRNGAFDITYSGPVLEYARNILEYEPNAYLWKNTKDINAANTPSIPEELRDRLRGFRDHHLNDTVERYRTTINSNIKQIENTINAVSQVMSNLDRRKNKGKHYYLNYHLNQLISLKQQLCSETDESMLVQRSATYLMRESSSFRLSKAAQGYMADIDIWQPMSYINTIDLKLDNPYRHLMWLTVPTFIEVEKCYRNNTDDAHIMKIIENSFDIFALFGALVEESFLEKRKWILCEVLKSARAKCYTSAIVLLFTQVEGLLFDLAIEINNKEFKGIKMTLFSHPIDTKKYYSTRKKCEEEVLSVERFLFDSQYKDFFWPGFLEYFASDFYSERSKMAHGENYIPATELDLKKLMLYALSILFIYREYVLTGDPPILSKLHDLGQR